jgi:hypothetical protein
MAQPFGRTPDLGDLSVLKHAISRNLLTAGTVGVGSRRRRDDPLPHRPFEHLAEQTVRPVRPDLGSALCDAVE